MLIATISMALALSTSTPRGGCQGTFRALLNGSVQSADRHEYAEAAALREAVAQVTMGCRNAIDGARGAFYPFDAASAYLVAADLWHSAGIDFQAQRALELAATFLRKVHESFHGQKDEFYEDHARLLREMIKARRSGKWGVWQ